MPSNGVRDATLRVYGALPTTDRFLWRSKERVNHGLEFVGRKVTGRASVHLPKGGIDQCRNAQAFSQDGRGIGRLAFRAANYPVDPTTEQGGQTKCSRSSDGGELPLLDGHGRVDHDLGVCDEHARHRANPIAHQDALRRRNVYRESPR